MVSEAGTTDRCKKTNAAEESDTFLQPKESLPEQAAFFQGERYLQQIVNSNNTLIVDGPASVWLVSGKVEVFGAQVKEMKRVLIREGKRLPFFVREKAVFDISLGVNAIIDEVAGRSTIPQSWNKPLEAILNAQKKPTIILILGKIDSGKSSYCAYLVNKLVNGNLESLF